ncbi:hypothetical protein Bbelb_104250 [Branchiostoma belcheri]|nr:hypothetical protein Bbelb_104250 [Branchiostoma belcheri]
MPGTQVVLSLFVLLLSCTTNTTTFRAGKKFCSGKCIYDPFVVFGRCNGVDLQLDQTVSARNLFSGCVFCDNIESENNGFPPCQLPMNIDILRFWISKYLLVINGSVHSIEPGTFNNTPRLNTLTISGNKLSRLAPGRFNELHSLENLRLDNNRIAQIEAGTFRNLTALSVLVLANNQLTRLEKDYFEGLSALEFIDLQHNKIEAIEPGTFTPFTYLMALLLSGNRLTVLAGGWSDGIGNLRLRLSMSNNAFRCECLPSWIPEYLSIQSPVRQAGGGAVCQFPPELKGEAITDALLHRLRPCPPPRVTVSAENGSERAFACEVLWEEEPHISWHLPGSLVLTVHVPGRYEETTSSRSPFENITTSVEHNVSLEGWSTPCEAPERSGPVYSYNTTCGYNFAGKTTSVLVIGQSQAAQWNNQTVQCVASAPRDSFSMHDATASAVISVVEDPSLETLNTGNLQDTTWRTMTSATTVVLSVLLDGPADSGTGYGGLYILISVVCAAALAVLWGYLLVAKLCCVHTDDANGPQQGTGDGNEQQTADASDHEYATIKDEDCVAPRLEARPDNEYEEIRDDATCSAYLPHSPRTSVHNKNSRKCNPHYSTKICENRPNGLYTIAENDGQKTAACLVVLKRRPERAIPKTAVFPVLVLEDFLSTPASPKTAILKAASCPVVLKSLPKTAISKMIVFPALVLKRLPKMAVPTTPLMLKNLSKTLVRPVNLRGHRETKMPKTRLVLKGLRETPVCPIMMKGPPETEVPKTPLALKAMPKLTLPKAPAEPKGLTEAAILPKTSMCPVVLTGLPEMAVTKVPKGLRATTILKPPTVMQKMPLLLKGPSKMPVLKTPALLKAMQKMTMQKSPVVLEGLSENAGGAEDICSAVEPSDGKDAGVSDSAEEPSKNGDAGDGGMCDSA